MTAAFAILGGVLFTAGLHLAGFDAIETILTLLGVICIVSSLEIYIEKQIEEHAHER